MLVARGRPTFYRVKKNDLSKQPLPRRVLDAVVGGEPRVARVMLWFTLAFFAVMVLLFFVTPDPMEEKLPTVPWFLGAFGAMIAYWIWLIRKPRRAHRLPIARLLRDDPGAVVEVTEQVVRVVAGGGGVQRATVKFDGERELAPRKEQQARVLFWKMNVNSFISLKVRGKMIPKRLVVPTHKAPALLSWLFATLAKENPSCKWGDTTVGGLTGQ